MSPKMKTVKGKGVGARFLAHDTSGLEGRVGTTGWGLKRLTNKSITHTDLHKTKEQVG